MQLSFNVFSWPMEPAKTKSIMIFMSNAHKYAHMHLYTCTHISFFILLPICMAVMALCLLEYCATTPVEFLDSNQILTPNFFGVFLQSKILHHHNHPGQATIGQSVAPVPSGSSRTPPPTKRNDVRDLCIMLLAQSVEIQYCVISCRSSKNFATFICVFLRSLLQTSYN
jgi:hypothetical protein